MENSIEERNFQNKSKTDDLKSHYSWIQESIRE